MQSVYLKCFIIQERWIAKGTKEKRRLPFYFFFILNFFFLISTSRASVKAVGTGHTHRVCRKPNMQMEELGLSAKRHWFIGSGKAGREEEEGHR